MNIYLHPSVCCDVYQLRLLEHRTQSTARIIKEGGRNHAKLISNDEAQARWRWRDRRVTNTTPPGAA